MRQHANPGKGTVPQNPEKHLVIWRFTDGKPGHEAQSQGLVDAIGRVVEAEVHEFKPGHRQMNFFGFIRGRFPAGNGLPKPDLLVGAGHATHWPMLAARRAFGGKLIVLMRPSLPLGCFDRCIVPKHDQPPPRSNVITTIGVLNPIIYKSGKNPAKGLILIGGESRHFTWDEACLKDQLNRLIVATPDVQWWLTSSRRTPASTMELLASLDGSGLTFVPHTKTPAGWVVEQMEDAAQTWVTADSVSMLYEARTASARVGVLKSSTRPGSSRVAAAVEKMIREKEVGCFAKGDDPFSWSRVNPRRLDEANRVAGILLKDLFEKPKD